MKRRVFLGTVGAAALCGQELAQTAAPDPNAIFVCPMDPDVRQHDPGTCPRCGMKLAAGLAEPAEYLLDLAVTPKPIRAGQPAELAFTVHDPWKHRPVTKFQIVHEKLFHMFVVSQDLEYFLHDHPVFSPDGSFRYSGFVLPKAGMYRILADFYPDASTPQLIAKTLLVPGVGPAPAVFEPSYVAKQSTNLRVEMRTVPEKPIAGMNTQLHFKLTPGDRFEQYLGAWGHMLAASEDLIDLVHTHPFISDPEAQGGPEIQFNLTFPRPDMNYRLWVQFQRAGQINTARFDVRAADLR
jgi:hypothetical protein